jgi:Endonuclease/Exonuclease/phosphatase family
LATWNPELTRNGPGLLLRDIRDREDPQIAAVIAVLARLDADVILLTGMDYDAGEVALRALQARLAQAGTAYPHALALRPNTGVQTGLDLDGNGQTGEPRDAQGYGRFAGQAGMAVLSRLPLGEARDFSGLLWADLPGADLPPDMTPEARAVQRLSTSGHYDLPVTLTNGRALHLLAWYATPPVFDGPEDRNGRRNQDEAGFWLQLLQGSLPWPPPEAPFVLLGQSNLDPVDGEGRPAVLQSLLAHPALQDPAPRGGNTVQDPGQTGDPALDTADYGAAIGRLRVDLVLPQAGLTVTGAGVLWPLEGDALMPVLRGASRHSPVWVEIDLP